MADEKEKNETTPNENTEEKTKQPVNAPVGNPEPEEKKKKKEKPKKKGGFLGKFLCFIFGFLFGIIAIVGGIAGAGYYVYKQPVQKTLDLVNRFAGTDLSATLFGDDEKSGILNEKYANSLVSDLLKDAFAAVKSLTGDGQLSALEEISPKVGDLVENLLKTTDKYGLPFKKDDIMNTSLKGLPDYLTTTLKSATLGGLLSGVNGEPVSDPLLLAICYGEEGVDYEYNDEGKVEMLEGKTATTIDSLLAGNGLSDKVGSLSLGTLLEGVNGEPIADPLLLSICYGEEGVDYEYNDEGKIEMLEGKTATTVSSLTSGNGMTDKIGSLSLGELLENIDGKPVSDPLLLTLCYGEEGVDYKKDDEGNITMLGDAKATTINDLISDKGMTDTIGTLALTSVMDINVEDAIMRAIAYGPASHYTMTDGEITMKQVYYKIEKDTTTDPATYTVYDSEGEVVKVGEGETATNAVFTPNENDETEGTLTLSEDGTEKQFLQKDGEYYYAFNESEFTTPIKYKPTKIDDLAQNASSLIDGLYITDALNINNASHKVIISLACGTENVDYKIEDDGSITFLGDAKPRTIGDLKNKNSELIDGILLYDALGINEDSHPVLKAIAEDENGNKRTLKDLSEKSTEIINGIRLTDALTLTNKTHPVLKSIMVEGVEGVDYELIENGVDDKGNTIYEVKLLTENGKINTLEDLSKNSDTLINGIVLVDALGIDENSHAVLKSIAYDPTTGAKRTLGDLSGDNSTAIINGIELEGALGIDENSHAVLKSIAYDPTTGAKRTLGDLSGDNGKEIINGIELVAALDINEDSHPVLKSISNYGKEPLRTLGDLSGDKSTEIINGIYLVEALSITPDTHPVLKAIMVEGVEGVDYEIVADGDKVDDQGNPIYKVNLLPNGNGKLNTLKDLSSNSENLIDHIALDTILGADSSSALTDFLLHGREGIHFNKVDGEYQYSQRRYLYHEGVLYNEYGEKLGDYATAPISYTVGEGEKAITYYLQKSATNETQTIKIKHIVDGKTQSVENVPALVYYAFMDAQHTENAMYAATTIGELKGDSINNLPKRMKVSELLSAEDKDNRFLKLLMDETFDTIPGAIEQLSIAEVYADVVYANGKDGELNGTWKYLLTDPTREKAPEDYTLHDFNDMVSNMTANIQTASLNSLKADGIINNLDGDLLEKNILKSIDIPKLQGMNLSYETYKLFVDEAGEVRTDKNKIGEMTVLELFDYVGKVITSFSSI